MPRCSITSHVAALPRCWRPTVPPGGLDPPRSGSRGQAVTRMAPAGPSVAPEGILEATRAYWERLAHVSHRSPLSSRRSRTIA